MIGSTFHRWVRDNRTRLKLGTEAENLTLITSHFPFFTQAYLTILDASRTYTKGLEAVFYNAHNEFTWQHTVLLAPLRVGDDPDTVRRKVGATATYLDIWLMRRVANYIRVGYSTTSYTMYLLCKDIRQKPLPELVETLAKKLAEDDATFEGSESRGRSGIAGLGLKRIGGFSGGAGVNSVNRGLASRQPLPYARVPTPLPSGVPNAASDPPHPPRRARGRVRRPVRLARPRPRPAE